MTLKIGYDLRKRLALDLHPRNEIRSQLRYGVTVRQAGGQQRCTGRSDASAVGGLIHATHDFSAHHPHPVTHQGPSLRLSRLCLSNARPPCAFVRRSRQRARRHRRRRRRRTKRWARRKKRGESPSCCSGRHAPQRMRHRSVWVRISPWEYACLPCRRRLEKRCHGFHPRALAIGLHPCNWADQ